MKKLLRYFLFCMFVNIAQLYSYGLLRERTVSHYEKLNLNKLLDEIGAQSITDAYQQIKGIQDLLISLESYSVAQAQKNLQALLNFVEELQEELGAQNIAQVTEQIGYLQSLRAHLADFEWKQ